MIQHSWKSLIVFLNTFQPDFSPQKSSLAVYDLKVEIRIWFSQICIYWYITLEKLVILFFNFFFSLISAVKKLLKKNYLAVSFYWYKSCIRMVSPWCQSGLRVVSEKYQSSVTVVGEWYLEILLNCWSSSLQFKNLVKMQIIYFQI